MCMIENGEDRAAVVSSVNYTAIKEHHCAECKRTISVGEVYLRETIIGDHRPTKHKTCAHCQIARCWLADECGGWIFGRVLDDIREHANDSDAGQVKVMADRMDQQWKMSDGWLFPLHSVAVQLVAAARIEPATKGVLSPSRSQQRTTAP